MAKKKNKPEPLNGLEEDLIDGLMAEKPCLRCKSKNHRGINCPRTEPRVWGDNFAKKSAGKKRAINAYIRTKQEEHWENLSEAEKDKKNMLPPWERRTDDSESDLEPQPKKEKVPPVPSDSKEQVSGSSAADRAESSPLLTDDDKKPTQGEVSEPLQAETAATEISDQQQSTAEGQAEPTKTTPGLESSSSTSPQDTENDKSNSTYEPVPDSDKEI